MKSLVGLNEVRVVGLGDGDGGPREVMCGFEVNQMKWNLVGSEWNITEGSFSFLHHLATYFKIFFYP